jgi:hypothetical protein
MKVSVTAKFPQMKPAHNAWIVKTGEGGSWAVAACDALRQIAHDPRLKAKQASNILPASVTIQLEVDPIGEAKRKWKNAERALTKARTGYFPEEITACEAAVEALAADYARLMKEGD